LTSGGFRIVSDKFVSCESF